MLEMAENSSFIREKLSKAAFHFAASTSSLKACVVPASTFVSGVGPPVTL